MKLSELDLWNRRLETLKPMSKPRRLTIADLKRHTIQTKAAACRISLDVISPDCRRNELVTTRALDSFQTSAAVINTLKPYLTKRERGDLAALLTDNNT